MRPFEDAERGLYRRYEVRRTDESGDFGGKHYLCKYFVLDLIHDKFAGAALGAYARACREEFPKLAADLVAIRHGDRSPLRKLRR